MIVPSVQPEGVRWRGWCRRCRALTSEQDTPLAAHEASVLHCKPIPLWPVSLVELVTL